MPRREAARGETAGDTQEADDARVALQKLQEEDDSVQKSAGGLCRLLDSRRCSILSTSGDG